MEKWKLLTTKKLLDTKWIKVHENSYELSNKNVIPQYYITERNDSALCVCYTGEHFILVEEYRPAIQKIVMCHPGGRIEEDDKTPVSGALRELLEETGYVPQKVVKLGAFAQIPAVTTSRVHIYLVHCDSNPTYEKKLDRTEELNLKKVTHDELIRGIDEGKMDCVACVAASYRALSYLCIPY